jgi:glycosyltransferase involved in cell wall biosynthesis
LVPPEDPASLAEALRTVADLKLPEDGPKRARQLFGTETVLDEFEAVFRDAEA